MEFPQRGEIYFVDFSPTGAGEVRFKLNEIVATVEKELAEFRARLVAEHRAQGREST